MKFNPLTGQLELVAASAGATIVVVSGGAAIQVFSAGSSVGYIPLLTTWP